MILIRIGYIILDMIDVMTCAKTSEFCFFFFWKFFFRYQVWVSYIHVKQHVHPWWASHASSWLCLSMGLLLSILHCQERASFIGQHRLLLVAMSILCYIMFQYAFYPGTSMQVIDWHCSCTLVNCLSSWQTVLDLQHQWTPPWHRESLDCHLWKKIAS